MMRENGLVKLSEEAAEVVQVAQKLIQYPALQLPMSAVVHGAAEAYAKLNGLHPDGTDLRARLQEEIGDMLAAADFVMNKLKLDFNAIAARKAMKLKLFHQWDNETE
jgi:NTP pyrophosphatase (non-canonical NTP hydrolase)